MIVTRTPFRIPLGGGGTDLPAYYSKHGGFVFSAGIDKYMFICLQEPFVDSLIRVKYSRTETVERWSDVQHDLVRAALQAQGIENAIEIVSMADAPAGTGLGSSSCYLVGLLNGLHTLKREYVSVEQLAQEACHIEMNVLRKPVGKQDQYLAAYGGLTVLDIDKDGTVHVREARVSEATIEELNRNSLIFYTGKARDSGEILSGQSKACTNEDKSVVENMHLIKEIGYQVLDAIESADLTRFGHLLHQHWETKKRLSSKISDPRLNELYEAGRQHGALGGKIMGAGGGGFFLFYVEENHQRFRETMTRRGLRELRYHFDFDGTKVIANLRNNQRIRRGETTALCQVPEAAVLS